MKIEFSLAKTPQHGNYRAFETIKFLGGSPSFGPPEIAAQNLNEDCKDCPMLKDCAPGSAIYYWRDDTRSLFFRGLRLGDKGCKVTENPGPFTTDINLKAPKLVHAEWVLGRVWTDA